VNFLLTEGKAELDDVESLALDNLAAAGLVPPLRMVLPDRDVSGF
jgi:hypothetical protein